MVEVLDQMKIRLTQPQVELGLSLAMSLVGHKAISDGEAGAYCTVGLVVICTAKDFAEN